MRWRLELGRILRRIAAAIDAHRKPAPRRELIDDDLPEPGWRRVSFGPSNRSAMRSRVWDDLGKDDQPSDGGQHFGGFN